MTFDELQNKIGKQDPSDWYQYKNGGGWVNKKAIIYNDPYIGFEAIVYDGVIHDGVIYGGVIHDGVIHGGVIHDGVIHGGVIHDGVIHGGEIHDGVIHGGIWKKSPLQIQGSRNFINTSNNNSITIGCMTETVDNWLLKYKEVGVNKGYTQEQIEEYYDYILLCKKYLDKKTLDK